MKKQISVREKKALAAADQAGFYRGWNEATKAAETKYKVQSATVYETRKRVEIEAVKAAAQATEALAHIIMDWRTG